MNIFGFDPATLMSFLLTFMRVSVMLFLLPFYGGSNLPNTVKAAVCLVLTLAIWPRVFFPAEYFPAHPFNLVLILLGELLLGILLGLMVSFIFAGVQYAGEVMATQMGFTMISLADPTSGGQMVITSYLLYNVAMAVFLALDGHLHLLGALVESFRLVPPGGLLIDGRLTADLIQISGQMFVIACKVAAPIIASLLLVEMGLALMAKVAPQMNLLMIGMPLKIGIGFFFMGIVFTALGSFMEDLILGLGPMFINVMRSAT